MCTCEICIYHVMSTCTLNTCIYIHGQHSKSAVALYIASWPIWTCTRAHTACTRTHTHTTCTTQRTYIVCTCVYRHIRIVKYVCTCVYRHICIVKYVCTDSFVHHHPTHKSCFLYHNSSHNKYCDTIAH